MSPEIAAEGLVRLSFLPPAQRRPSEVGLPGPVASGDIQIAGRAITRSLAPYLVAELSCNHSGSIDKAKRLIDAAQEAGADAVKLQTYKPEELTTPEHKALWTLYEKAHTPREWHEGAIQSRTGCRDHDILVCVLG
jgi:sialic acid synthase SpsE